MFLEDVLLPTLFISLILLQTLLLISTHPHQYYHILISKRKTHQKYIQQTCMPKMHPNISSQSWCLQTERYHTQALPKQTITYLDMFHWIECWEAFKQYMCMIPVKTKGNEPMKIYIYALEGILQTQQIHSTKRRIVVSHQSI